MEATAYLDRLLERLSGSFDIYRPYRTAEKEYPAYGYFFSMSEKYVATKKAKLWAIRTYEHVIFLITERCTEETIAEARHLMEDHMEPDLVRKGEKYPEPDHMVSNLTVVILSEKSPDPQTAEDVSRFKYDKSYLFTVRGHSEGHLICADLEKEQVTCNRPARQMLNIFTKSFAANEAQREE